MLASGHYEARTGCLEFRNGLLVGFWFGRHSQSNDAGLTVGITLLAESPPGIALAGGRSRAVARVYSLGALDSETDLGEVIVYGDRPDA
jgi:hypothetical protein